MYMNVHMYMHVLKNTFHFGPPIIIILHFIVASDPPLVNNIRPLPLTLSLSTPPPSLFPLQGRQDT